MTQILILLYIFCLWNNSYSFINQKCQLVTDLFNVHSSSTVDNLEGDMTKVYIQWWKFLSCRLHEGAFNSFLHILKNIQVKTDSDWLINSFVWWGPSFYLFVIRKFKIIHVEFLIVHSLKNTVKTPQTHKAGL